MSYTQWCIFLIALAALGWGGLVGSKANTLPNQEVVLQFSSEDFSPVDAEHTIALVKRELNRLGIEAVQITDHDNGKLTIAYYSRTKAGQVRQILAAQRELALGMVDHPEKQNSVPPPAHDQKVSYNLEVYEIQQGQGPGSDLGGQCAIEYKQGPYRFLNPHVAGLLPYLEYHDPTIVSEHKSAFAPLDQITLKPKSHQTPEVRAGPIDGHC